MAPDMRSTPGRLLSLAGLLCLASVRALSSHSEPQEICQFQTFNATCGQEEVIIMKHARYGRMKLGRCLTTDVFIGCFTDILQIADRRCSGRHHCTIALPDEELHQALPCAKDMGAYLETQYTCVPVSSMEPQTCRGSLTLKQQEGHLSNAITENYGFGSQLCPWVLNVEKGQRLNITLLDFTVDLLDSRLNSNIHQGICNVYAIIKEMKYDTVNGETIERESSVSVCGGEKRAGSVYISQGNVVQVEIVGLSKPDKQIYFLLKYEALGCPDPKMPPHTWLKRDEEKATVRCNFTSQTWHLVCKGNKWFGNVGNCTGGYAWNNPQGDGLWPPYGLVAAVIIGVILGIGLGLCLLGIVILCRKRRQRHSLHRPDAYATYQQGYREQAKIVHPHEQGYTHVWELGSHKEPKADLFDPRMQKLSMYHERAQNLKGPQPPPPPRRDHHEHIYESPKFARAGPRAHPNEPPFYHEFDMEHDQGRTHRKLEEGDITSDDTEDELDKCDIRFAVKGGPGGGPGYRPVPGGTLEMDRMDRQGKRIDS